MKTVPAALLAHYQQQVQTLAFCTLLSLAARQPRVVALTRANPGVVSTANHCISAIPYVCAADAGIKTYLDLPLIAGRAAPDLAVGRTGC